MTKDNKYLELQKIYTDTVSNNKPVYLMIDTAEPDTIIPVKLKNTGHQTLNVSPKAVLNLSFTNDYLEFTTCFDKVQHNLSIPYQAIIMLIEGE